LSRLTARVLESDDGQQGEAAALDGVPAPSRAMNVLPWGYVIRK